MKLGVFGAQLSKRTYLTMMVVGYGIGLPLMVFDVIHETSNAASSWAGNCEVRCSTKQLACS